jgi:hypothetical protein
MWVLNKPKGWKIYLQLSFKYYKEINNLKHMQYSNVSIIEILKMKNYVYNYLYN